MRLFVALLFAPALRAHATAERDRLAALDAGDAVRWVDPGALHLTLKFLGEVAPLRLASIRAAVGAAVRGPAPSLYLHKLGAFPTPRRPRVIWLGLDGDIEILAALQERVEAGLHGLGWPRENRDFSPHVTVGRVRHGAGRSAALSHALQSRLMAAELAVPGEFELQSEVAVMKSHLDPSGARYEALASFQLVAPTARG